MWPEAAGGGGGNVKQGWLQAQLALQPAPRSRPSGSRPKRSPCTGTLPPPRRTGGGHAPHARVARRAAAQRHPLLIRQREVGGVGALLWSQSGKAGREGERLDGGGEGRSSLSRSNAPLKDPRHSLKPPRPLQGPGRRRRPPCGRGRRRRTPPAPRSPGCSRCLRGGARNQPTQLAAVPRLCAAARPLCAAAQPHAAAAPATRASRREQQHHAAAQAGGCSAPERRPPLRAHVQQSQAQPPQPVQRSTMQHNRANSTQHQRTKQHTAPPQPGPPQPSPPLRVSTISMSTRHGHMPSTSRL